MPFCHQCGKESTGSDSYCRSCGAKLRGVTIPAPVDERDATEASVGGSTPIAPILPKVAQSSETIRSDNPVIKGF